MDHKSVEGRDIVDLESGGSECENDRRNEPMSGNRRATTVLGPSTLDGLDKSEYRTDSYKNSAKLSNDDYDNMELLIENKFGGDNGAGEPLIEKKQVKEKPKMSNSKRAAKPPRPRKGPSLDTADLKFVKEFSELAMKKRARIERMKALGKMKAAQSSPSSSSRSSLFAMAITLLLFLVIIFQGFCSGNGSALQTSPAPSAAATNGLITVQFYDNNSLGSNDIRSSSEPPKSPLQL